MARKSRKRRESVKGSFDYSICPFVVVVDSNESAPYLFKGYRTNKTEGDLPLLIETKRKPLWSMHKQVIETDRGRFNKGLADYSIDGIEEEIQIERKSLSDLFTTMGQRRDSFEAEIARLNLCNVAYVLIEASWTEIAKGVPSSAMNPLSVTRSITAWEQRYPNVKFHAMGSRQACEAKCFRSLERYWLDRNGDKT